MDYFFGFGVNVPVEYTVEEQAVAEEQLSQAIEQMLEADDE